MSDAECAALLRSDHRLVVIEAPAGCGKTYQGANYACDVARQPGSGRVLILTHTHGACGVFAERTAGLSDRVEIRTIDGLIALIAGAYHQVLNLPYEPAAWAWRDGGAGFGIMAERVAALLEARPMIAESLAARYPVVICDEHQDTTQDQHRVVMALYSAGAALRIFGDPWQAIFGDRKSDAALRAHHQRWADLRAQGAGTELDVPHRWDHGCPELGRWVLRARDALRNGNAIHLTADLPPSLHILPGDNLAYDRGGFRLETMQGRPIRDLALNLGQMMVLADRSLINGLNSFWYRSIPIWEGHTRRDLAILVAALRDHAGDGEQLAQAVATFMNSIAKGFTQTSHGRRLVQEARTGCRGQARGLPAALQQIARCIVEDPSHRGVAAALSLIEDMVADGRQGFRAVKIDYRAEFRDAVRLGQYENPEDGYGTVASRRARLRPVMPDRVLCSIHMAKGLECDHAMVVGCDSQRFTGTLYARCKLYVALSRARRSLTLVIPRNNPSPLFQAV